MFNRREYDNLVSAAGNVKLQCQFCVATISVRAYLQHVNQKHADKKSKGKNNICIWCFTYSWTRRDLFVNNFEHRIQCLKDRIHFEEKASEVAAVEPDHELGTGDVRCLECNDWWLMLITQEEEYQKRLVDQNVDGDWMQFFMTTYEKINSWFMYSIQIELWDKFYQMAMANLKLFYVIPYWRLCNGGHGHDNSIMHHRHVILSVPNVNLQKFKYLLNNGEGALSTFPTGELFKLNPFYNGKDFGKQIILPITKEKLKGPDDFKKAWIYIESKAPVCWNDRDRDEEYRSDDENGGNCTPLESDDLIANRLQEAMF